MATRRFLPDLRGLGRIYWTSPPARRGGLMLALAVSLELGTVCEVDEATEARFYASLGARADAGGAGGAAGRLTWTR